MTITGQSTLAKDDIEKMVKDAEAHAEEDKQRREEAETRNNADSLVNQTEKVLRDQGDKVDAAPPAALHDLPKGSPPNRMGLAKWIVDPANPLTARVTANRFWQELFGQGIVVTAEDFGVMGSAPTHPELLDWLAADFVTNGWSVKHLVRQIGLIASRPFGIDELGATPSIEAVRQHQDRGLAPLLGDELVE